MTKAQIELMLLLASQLEIQIGAGYGKALEIRRLADQVRQEVIASERDGAMAK